MDDPPEQYLTGFDSTFWSLPPLILFFLLCSAMFSAGETAYFSLTKAQLDLLRTSASAGHRRILRHLSDPRRLLANLLIGNNVVNLTIILLFYFMFFKVLDFGPYPWIPAVLQTFVVTALIVFVGEVIPKVYASRNPLSVALWFSMPLQVSAWVFRPIIWVLINSTGLLDRWIVRKQTQLSKDEINQAIDLTFGQEQARSGSEKELLKGIVNFGELEVRQIMVPRLEIKALDSKSSLEEVLPLLRDWGYSRVPVFSESLDQIVGILYLKDLFTTVGSIKDAISGGRNCCANLLWFLIPSILMICFGNSNPDECTWPWPSMNTAGFRVWLPWRIFWSKSSEKFRTNSIPMNKGFVAKLTPINTGWPAKCFCRICPERPAGTGPNFPKSWRGLKRWPG